MSKDNSESKNLDVFTTRINPELKEKVRAFAWYNRKTQREILEKALDDYFKKHVDNIEKMVDTFRERGST